MRKYKLILVSLLVVASVVTTGAYLGVQTQNNAVAQTSDMSEQERARQLSEWQQKLRMWEQQDQANSQATLSNQGVEMLPDTGSGTTLAICLMVAAISSAMYLTASKFLFKA